eukprot:TRINITY_DN8034_c0_g3_i2.p1 TRINITY_DN8034_c0_g3~~TRINITY_DN8034_c0_g3_i2.p1  ORF type:complete len:359 (+),score=43.30 TRINITY_DN8034_c0_g3_i2:36-1112(+)
MGQHCWKDKHPKNEGKTKQNETTYAEKKSEAADDKKLSETSRKPGFFHEGDEICSISGIGEGSAVLGGEDGGLKVVNLHTGKIQSEHTGGHKGDVRRIYHHTTTDIITTSGRDKTAKIWSLGPPENRQLQHLRTLTGHTMAVANCCMNDSGDRVVTGSRDNSMRLWNTETGDAIKIKTVARNLVHCMAWLQNDTVVQGGENLKLYLWDVRDDNLNQLTDAITGVPDQPVCMLKDTSSEFSIFVGYKGFTAASAVVRQWDIRMQKEVLKFTGHDKCLTDIACFSSDVLLSAAQDRSIIAWDRASGDMICSASLASKGAPTDFSVTGDLCSVSTTEGEVIVHSFDKDKGCFMPPLTYAHD